MIIGQRCTSAVDIFSFGVVLWVSCDAVVMVCRAAGAREARRLAAPAAGSPGQACRPCHTPSGQYLSPVMPRRAGDRHGRAAAPRRDEAAACSGGVPAGAGGATTAPACRCSCAAAGLNTRSAHANPHLLCLPRPACCVTAGGVRPDPALHGAGARGPPHRAAADAAAGGAAEQRQRAQLSAGTLPASLFTLSFPRVCRFSPLSQDPSRTARRSAPCVLFFMPSPSPFAAFSLPHRHRDSLLQCFSIPFIQGCQTANPATMLNGALAARRWRCERWGGGSEQRRGAAASGFLDLWAPSQAAATTPWGSRPPHRRRLPPPRSSSSASAISTCSRLISAR